MQNKTRLYLDSWFDPAVRSDYGPEIACGMEDLPRI